MSCYVWESTKDLLEEWQKMQQAGWSNPDRRPDWSGARGHAQVNMWTDDDTVHLKGINVLLRFHVPLHLVLVRTIHISHLRHRRCTCIFYRHGNQSACLKPDRGSEADPSCVHPWWCSNWMGWPFFTVILRHTMSAGGWALIKKHRGWADWCVLLLAWSRTDSDR